MRRTAAMAQATTFHFGPGARSVRAAARREFVVAFTLVAALHAALAVWMLRAHERPAPLPEPPRTIVAKLLSAAPATTLAPAAPPTPAQSLPGSRQAPAAAHTIEPPRSAPRVRPKPAVVPAPVPTHRETQPSRRERLRPAPSPEAATPAPVATPATPVATTTPAVPSATPDTARSGAPAQPSAANAPPKEVSHVDCNIAQPDYPEASRRRGETGTAVVRFVVGVDGRVENAKIQQSSGYARLDDAALGALRGGTCRPWKEAGVPVRVAYAQPFVFGLGN